MGIATDPARELALKIEVLRDLEEPVRELMENHERKRELWFPSDFLSAQPENCPDDFVRRLRDQAVCVSLVPLLRQDHHVHQMGHPAPQPVPEPPDPVADLVAENEVMLVERPG